MHLWCTQAAVNGILSFIIKLEKGLRHFFTFNYIRFKGSMKELTSGQFPILDINFNMMGHNVDFEFDKFSLTDWGPMILELGYKLLRSMRI